MPAPPRRPPTVRAHPAATRGCALSPPLVSRNVNKVALFRRVIDKKELKVGALGDNHTLWASAARACICVHATRPSARRRSSAPCRPCRPPSRQVITRSQQDKGEQAVSVYNYAPDPVDLQVGRGAAAGGPEACLPAWPSGVAV